MYLKGHTAESWYKNGKSKEQKILFFSSRQLQSLDGEEYDAQNFNFASKVCWKLGILADILYP